MHFRHVGDRRKPQLLSWGRSPSTENRMDSAILWSGNSQTQGISCIQTSRTAVLDGTQKLSVFDDTSASAKPHSAEGGPREYTYSRRCSRIYQFLTFARRANLQGGVAHRVFDL